MHNIQILYGLSPAFFSNFTFISGLLSQVPYTPVTFAILLTHCQFSHIYAFVWAFLYAQNAFSFHVSTWKTTVYALRLIWNVITSVSVSTNFLDSCKQISLPWISSAQHAKHMLLQTLTKGTHAGLPPSDHEACFPFIFVPKSTVECLAHSWSSV